jgi:hypothetical protein
MAGLKLTITGWGEVALDKREMRRLLGAAGRDIQRKTQRLLVRSQGGGRVYRGGGGAAYRGQYRAGSYRASAPGDAPVTVSGGLRTSLRTFAYPSGDGFAVRARQFYALFLEAGARGGGNYGSRGGPRRRGRARDRGGVRVLDPRPFLRRVMTAEGPSLRERIRTALTRGVTWRETRPGAGG